jgi:hypothetical protein
VDFSISAVAAHDFELTINGLDQICGRRELPAGIVALAKRLCHI